MYRLLEGIAPSFIAQESFQIDAYVTFEYGPIFNDTLLIQAGKTFFSWLEPLVKGSVLELFYDG